MFALFGRVRVGEGGRYFVSGHPFPAQPNVEVTWMRGERFYRVVLTMDEVDILIDELKSARREHRRAIR